MAFQLKNFVSIAAAMINHVRGVQSDVTDFNVGSVVRTMLEAPAIEIDECYQQIFNGLRDAIPVATYQSFSFAALPALPATGPATVTIAASSQDVTIPAGTIFTPQSGSSFTFSNALPVTIAAGGTTAAVTIAATTPGAAGNLGAGTAFALSPLPTGFVSCANARIFDNGQDLETDDQRKQRFTAYIQTLQRATNAGLIFGAKTVAITDASGVITEQVATAAVVEPYIADNTQPIAEIKVYVHNGQGSTSGALVSKTDAVLRGYVDTNGVKVPGYKSAGVKMTCFAATEQTVAITGAITLEPGAVAATVIAAATLAIQRHLVELDIGVSSLYKDRVILIGNLDGVANIVFSVGTADVACSAPNNKLMPGVVTFTAS